MSGNRFAWERAVMASDLPRGTRLILFTIGAHMDNKTRRAATTNAELGKAAGVSARTVQTHLKRASDAGWLTRLQRGHHVEGQRSAPSVYVGTFPEPTGSVLPDGIEANRKPVSGSVVSQPEDDDSQPENGREPTGSQLPTSHSVHSEHCGSGERFDDIDLEVHKQIKAKKDRGEPIRNERALRRSIREDIVAQRELDRLLEEQAAANDDRFVAGDQLHPAAEALGRNLAGVEATESGIRDAMQASGLPIRAFPSLIESAVEAWRERTNELRRTA